MPHDLTFSMASSAVSLNWSTDANHWSVARKIVGFFVRQSYGYLCWYASLARRPPASSRATKTSSLPS